MPFTTGQTIVHPFHGPLLVTQISDRAVGGATRTYFHLSALGHPLQISIPVDSVDEIGLRPLASRARIDSLLDILRGPGDPTPAGWARRLKDYQARANSGDIEQLCYVVREITRRNPKSPASAESQLLRTVTNTLSVEISLALSLSDEDARSLIHDAASGTDGR